MTTTNKTKSINPNVSPTGRLGGTFGINNKLDDLQRSSWGNKERYEPLEKTKSGPGPNKTNK